MKVVAGCDGGGTKCHVKICLCDDDGAILQSVEAISGAANIRSNPKMALQNIQQATKAAIARLERIDQPVIDTMVAALAGAGNKDSQVEWQSILVEKFPTAHVEVVTDAEILFAAAQKEGAAVATIIGTGSIAWARDHEGRLFRAGGLGPEAGDEGSAFWIGKQAVQYVENSGDSSQLTESVKKEKSNSSAMLTNREIAQLAPIVFELAKKDVAAERIVASAAEHIARLIKDSTQSISTSASQPLAWICAGGVAIGQPRFLEAARKAASTSVHLSPPIPVKAPVEGSLRLAMQKQFGAS